MSAFTRETSIEEMMESPTKFGMPTLSEFMRDKERYVGRPDDEVVAIDRGDSILKCRQKYYVEGYAVDCLEQGQRIAQEMGLDFFRDFVVKPQLKPDPHSRMGYYNEVSFWSKATIEKRKAWR